jgi:probable F420-dependent oxidoreductase
MRPFRFAVQVGGAGTGTEWLDLARRMEALGYGTLSMPDHVVGDAFAGLAALAAAATVTTRIRLGNLVLNNDFRNPLLVAREALTLDVLSGGRLELGLGAGWLTGDYDALGLSFDPPSVRLARLAEAVVVLKQLFTEDAVSFEGRFYRLVRARALPRAVQLPRPPILVAGGGPRLLELAAREADIVGLFLTRHFTKARALDFSRASAEMQVAHVRAHAAGREIELNVTITDLVVTGDRRGAIAQVAREREQDDRAIETSPYVLIGTLDEIGRQLVAVRDDLGISYFSLRGPFVETVAPVVRELTGS